jgi:hypothetical protein
MKGTVGTDRIEIENNVAVNIFFDQKEDLESFHSQL